MPPINDDMLTVRLPSKIKEQLDRKLPEVRDRNNLIRALLKKYLDGDVAITGYEIEIANS